MSNVRLEYNTSFLAGCYWNDQVWFNNYQVKLELLTQTYDGVEQNVCLERLKYMLYQEFTNSVFVEENETEIIKKLEDAGMKVIALPEQPVDQIVGTMLYCKLNAVMEDRIFITQLKLSSAIGGGVVYLQDDEEGVEPFEYKGWWVESDPYCVDKKRNSDKIVELKKQLTWEMLDLDWDDEEVEVDLAPENKNVVKFQKDDKE